MATVKVIPPKEAEPKTLRVAAYCRVSSDSADQLHSYAAQIMAYTDEIEKHPNWVLVDIYADEAVTGTRMEQRDEFNRMIADCRRGKIDRILVKSTSRFARNTKDFLTVLRELTSLGVSVYFEEDHIDSVTLTSELMVSVYSALAQEESVSIGLNQRMSYQRRMERGEFITCYAPLGYRIRDGKELEIVEEEAELVRWRMDCGTATGKRNPYVIGTGRLASPDGPENAGEREVHRLYPLPENLHHNRLPLRPKNQPWGYRPILRREDTPRHHLRRHVPEGAGTDAEAGLPKGDSSQ